MMRRNVIVRRTPIELAKSAGICAPDDWDRFDVDMRMLVLLEGSFNNTSAGGSSCPATQ
jgi:hypothetical protein